MTQAQDFHRRAMDLAEEADLARLRGDILRYRKLIATAFHLELEAAKLIAPLDDEPTRSVLHRSAASLAIECGEFREAERLIGSALSGSPPCEILDELRSLLQTTHFHDGLAKSGFELEPNELQFTMIGGQVGEGIAPSEEFLRRVELFDKLVFRSAERHLGRPFRKQGRRDRTIQDSVELFVKTPRAASFAVCFRLGRKSLFPDLDAGVRVIEDIVLAFEHFQRAEIGPLRKMITDESYYKNFVAIAKRLGPDGQRVGTVGLTGIVHGRQRSVILKPRSGSEFEYPAELESTAPHKRIEVKGTLLLADAVGAQWGKIDVVSEDGQKTRFRVSPEMMADIVRPFFDSEVVIVGHRKGQHTYLDDINGL